MNKLTAEWLQARSEIVALLVREGALDTQNDRAGFYRSDGTFVSVYDLLDGELA